MASRMYPWEEWFNKPHTVLRRGVHYHVSQSIMHQMIRNNASKRGIRVRLIDTDDEIIINVVGVIDRKNYEVHYPDTTTIAG